MKNYGNLAENICAAERQLLFQHHPTNTDGWITLAKKDPQTKRFRQYHYKPEELASSLSEWMGEDVYYSQNSFFKPQRRIDNIRQLRSLYVDLDVYNYGLTPEWVLAKLDYEYFGQVLPDPNMVIFSGRGLVLIWNIEPVPYMAMPLWRAVENYFMEQLKDLGADSKATDPARIFRLAGSINSKNQAVVRAEYRHDYRYDIHQLQYDYLPELSPKNQDPKKRGPKPKIVRMFNTYTLHLSRARDIAKLVELRQGEVNNYREYICFLYRYFTCCYTSDPQQALEDTLDLNSEFTSPLPKREVISATKSAEKAWAAKSDAKADALAKAMGYPGAGYHLKNSKIIEWLDISPEEQKEMSTIIGPQEKRRRNTKAKRDKRREEGMKPREEYLSEAEQKRAMIRKAIEDNPGMSIRSLAQVTGQSKSAIQRVKASLAE
ncbi:MAG: DNA-binding response regulator [Faecousia sp.]